MEKGLFGKPTVENNVETLVNVLPILTMGAQAYAAIGTAKSTGPKLFCVSGSVARPGIYELPFGATLGNSSASLASAAISARSSSAERRAVSCAPTNWTSRSPSKAPARRARPSVPVS
ncbi:hypothetical protein SHKM778_34900 [Streptomyces sp. KM77-8]|uniref:Uncharacterized protein n=1 Tax=Streptomyces haneummycinicus TaxID=3074435 RepID=A0AAT9HIF7_9ACTN